MRSWLIFCNSCVFRDCVPRGCLRLRLRKEPSTADRPRDIGSEEARAKGVFADHTEMPTGELRFRLKHDDGTAYSRTEASAGGGWQKSHYHAGIRETYIVQRGRMALAELVEGALKLRTFGPSEICTTRPNVPHNVYLFRNSVIHSVKHGDAGDRADWHASPALDARTIHLDETEIMRLVENPGVDSQCEAVRGPPMTHRAAARPCRGPQLK